MRAAIIIPARLQSTRLPNKLLLDETGRPLITYAMERAAQIRDLSDGLFERVIVAADTVTIVQAVENYSARFGLDIQAIMTDPNHQSGSDRVAEAARALSPKIDSILNLQGDEPDIPAISVLQLAEFFTTIRPDIATLVYPITNQEDRENRALVKTVLGIGGRALYFSRADIPYRRDDGDFSPPSYGHVGIYLYARPALERFVTLPAGALEQTEKLEQLRALENGMTIAAHVLAERPPKGIDTREDYSEFVKIRSGIL